MVNIYPSFIRKWIESKVFHETECLIHIQIGSTWHFNKMKIILYYFLCTKPQITSWLYFSLITSSIREVLNFTCSKVVWKKIWLCKYGKKEYGKESMFVYRNRKHMRHAMCSHNIYRECLLCWFLRALYENIERVCFHKLMFVVSIPQKFA